MKTLNKLSGSMLMLSFTATIFLAASLPAQILITAAGGFVGDGGQATNASLIFPEGIAIDIAGNLYIGGFSQQRVRKVTPSGVITTVAGTGIAGFSGDGGPANAATLSFPTGIAVDAAGSLLIAAQGNNRIRKVNSSGIITTIAGNGVAGYSGDGGPATQASLHGPWGITLDALGNIYFSDIGNQRIRKIDTFGIITTVAGNGIAGYNGDGIAAISASLNFPRGVLVDSAGNLYIADTANHRVRKVDSSGTISTVAGNGEGGFGGDGGLATAARVTPRFLIFDSSGNLLISGNSRVRKVDLSSKIITTIAGSFGGTFNGDGQTALNTMFGGTSGLLFDSAGNLLLADSLNSRVRKISPSQIVTTVAGGYIGDGGPATSASLNQPEHVAFDSIGNIYIADTFNNRVRKVTPSGTISTVAGTGISGYTGDGGPATAATLFIPQAVAVNSSGKVFVADNGNGVIREVDTAGVITTFLQSPAVFSIGTMTFDTSDNLYFADQSGCVVQKVNPLGTVATVAGIQSACGFNGDGPATSVNLNSPYGVAVDSEGSIYVGDAGNDRVRKVDASGNLTTIAGNGTCGFSGDGESAIFAMLCSPSGIALGGGTIFVADSSNQRIRKIDNFGIITTIAGSSSVGFNGDGLPTKSANLDDPIAVAVDPVGDVYVVDDLSYRIREAPAPVVQTVTLTPTSNSATVMNDSNSNAWTITLNGLTGTANATIVFTEVPSTAVDDLGQPCELASADGTKCVVHQVSVDVDPSNYPGGIDFYHHWNFKPGTPLNPRMIKNGSEDITTQVFLDPGTSGHTRTPSTYTDNDAGTASAAFPGFLAPLAPRNSRIFSVGTTIAVKFKAVVPNATPQLSVAIAGTKQGTSGANFKAINPDTFRLNTKSANFEFYLSTVGWAPGQYVLSEFTLNNAIAPAFVTFTLQ